MKLISHKLKLAAVGIVAASFLFITGCSKDDYNAGPAEDQGAVSRIVDPSTQNKIEKAANKIPAISWYNSTMDKVITFDPKNETKSFSFSDPNPGFNFSNSNQVNWVPANGGGGILFVGPGAFGGNSASGGAGTVIAGSTVLNISSTFCFSASEEALGLDIGGFGGPDFDGISGVIGFAGDLEALSTGDFESEDEIFDFFDGIAYYVVYDNEASGSYDILNWFDGFSEDPDDLGGDGFAWVYGFSPDSWSLWFSQSGTLNVSGGSMNFNGEYFGIELNFDDLFEDDGDDLFDLQFSEGTGYGQMGCN